MLFPAQTGNMQNSFTKSIVFIAGVFIALFTSGSKDKLTPRRLTYKIKSKWKPNLMTPVLL